MPDLPDDPSPPGRPRELSEEVGTKEWRKVRARRTGDRTLWVGLGMFGVVGWSVTVPTLIGIILGLWFDRIWPGEFSWTLALLLAGVTLGCLSAWYWISQERQAIDAEQQDIP
jgi:ATP synthase protein I